MADEIIKVLDDLAARMGVAINWSAENVLPYVTELSEKIVRYELWTSVVALLVPITFGIMLFLFAKCVFKPRTRKCIKYSYDTHRDEEVEETYTIRNENDMLVDIALFVSILLEVVLIACNLLNVFDIIACLTFPEKVILEYLQELM